MRADSSVKTGKVELLKEEFFLALFEIRIITKIREILQDSFYYF